MSLDLLGPASAPGAVTDRPTDTRVFNETDTWFKACSSPNNQDGTYLQAGFMNGLLGQLRYALRASGIALDNADDAMLWKAILRAVSASTPAGSIIYRGANTGTVNALVADLDPNPVQYETRGVYVISLNGPNTGPVTANLENLGVKQVLRSNGTQLRPGDIRRVAALVYDGAALVLLNLAQEVAPPGSGFTGDQQRFGYTGQTNVPSILTASFTAVYAGVVLGFSTLNTTPANGNNTNLITIKVNTVERNGAADAIDGASTSTTNATVKPGDVVTITSKVTPNGNPQFGMSQYLTYVFIPG